MQTDSARLTEREEQVLGLIAAGRTNAEIAAELGVAFPTAKAHVSNIISKLGVETREEAVRAWEAQRGKPPASGRRRWLGVPVALAGSWRPIVLGASAAVAAIVVVALAVAALASRSDEGGPASPGAEGTATATAEPDTLVGPHLIEETTDVWIHETFPAGVTPDRTPGLYSWDIASGVVDRWRIQDGGEAWVGISEDGRWVDSAAAEGGTTYHHLYDSETGRSWRWPDDPLLLTEAAGDRVAIRARPLPGAVYTFDASMNLLATESTGAPASPPADGPSPQWTDASPDGTLYVSADPIRIDHPYGDLAVYWGGMTVYDTATGEPLFRIRGAGLTRDSWLASTRWLADSSGFIVMLATPAEEAEGPASNYAIVARDGSSIRKLPFTGTWLPLDVFPSPIDPDVVALGYSGTVLNLATGARIERGFAWESPGPATTPWSADGRTVRWQSEAPGGHGAWKHLFFTTPHVEFPPFADTYQFVVARSDTCLNVRAAPTAEGEIVACLVDGTAVQAAPIAVSDDGVTATPEREPIIAWPDADFGAASHDWLHVRAGDGAEGWVSADYLDWAE